MPPLLRSHNIAKPSRLHRAGKRVSRRINVWSFVAAASLLGSAVFHPKADAVVTFSFDFADPAGTGFNDPAHPEYKAGLIDAARTMGSYYSNTATVTMRVTGTNDPNSGTLASAGSGIISTTGAAGFFRTIVQEKVITNGATDLNGATADGEVNVNLGSPFQYDPNAAIGANQIDFKGTMIHELTHAFGFLSVFSQTPNTNSPGLYSTFDSFLSDASGAPLINPNTFVFDPSKVSTLTGGNNTIRPTSSPGGEFFSGANAKAGFGAKSVPIFCPNPYQEGSSGSHVDDNTQATHYYLMAAAAESGPAMMGVTMVRTYSTAEAGIMTDLGYTLAGTHPAFFTGEVALANSVYYLQFANGTPFGYYSFLSDPRYIYHFDLGYEYIFDAADGKNGVYFYDFKSNTFFYTNPTFPFPYLYDFTLNSVVYYYPDPNNAGRYNTNGVRYFYVFNTGKIISK